MKETEIFKQADQLLSLIPRTVKNMMAPLALWNENREKRLLRMAEAIDKEARNQGLTELSDPPEHIAVPALMAMSYSMDSDELREMYAKLLVSSMNPDTVEMTHPSFVDIIRQMDPIDARVIFALINYSTYPIVEIRASKPDESSFNTIAPAFTVLSFPNYNPETISFQISNLVRLGLLEIPATYTLSHKEAYIPIEEHKYVQKLRQRIELQDGRKLRLEHQMLRFTETGNRFVKVCL